MKSAQFLDISQGPEMGGKSEFHGSLWADLGSICWLADFIKTLENLEYYEQKHRLVNSVVFFFFFLKILPTKMKLELPLNELNQRELEFHMTLLH